MDKVVALYLRLSKADRRAEDKKGGMPEQEVAEASVPIKAAECSDGQGVTASMSIRNQQALLEQYARRDEELCRYKTKLFIDDGFSGLEDSRPALQKMLSMVMRGEVYAVLVKDLSRLSRNHLYLASLREQVFPSYSTELISLGDTYDSRRDGGNMLALRFKSLFYEYYSRDISRKVKASLTAKKEKGEYAVAKPPYGYRLENGSWRVEKREAEVIQRVFELAAEGCPGSEIATVVGREMPPVNIYPVKVMRILGNPVYCGKHVWHKYENHIGFYKRSVSLPREKWRVDEGSHPAIISEELFLKAQERRQIQREFSSPSQQS